MKTIERIESKIEALLETYAIAELIEMKIKPDKIKKHLPQKYLKLLDNYLNNDSSLSKYALTDFYKYCSDNTYDIFDYIPLGYDNANYLVYHIPTKKLYGFSHESLYTKNRPGIILKGDHYTNYAEHLRQAVTTTTKMFKQYNSIEEFEKSLSKYLGFKINLDPLEYNDKDMYISVYADKEQDAYDNFGSSEVFKKLGSFKNQI